MKEKIEKVKTKLKDFYHNHEKEIKIGAGIITTVAGTIAVVGKAMADNKKEESESDGWFANKYGKDTHPKMSIDTYCDLADKFGDDYATELLEDVQDGIYTEKQIRDTYFNKSSKQNRTDYELADFCRGGELSEDD